jgi:hypothetical protein
MSGIGDLTTTTALALADLFPLESASDRDARKASLSALRDFLQANLTFSASDLVQQYAAPSATGFSVSIAVGNTWLILTPVAGYAAGTIVLPANPTNEQVVNLNTTQAVTTLTVNGNGKTVTGAPTTLAANAFFTLRFDATTNAWYRVA